MRKETVNRADGNNVYSKYPQESFSGAENDVYNSVRKSKKLLYFANEAENRAGVGEETSFFIVFGGSLLTS